MKQEIIRIVDDIIKIGMFFFKDPDNPSSCLKALENYLGHKTNSKLEEPYEILETFFQMCLIKTFQYYLKQTNDKFAGSLISVELNNNDLDKRVLLRIDSVKAEQFNLTDINIDLNDLLSPQR